MTTYKLAPWVTHERLDDEVIAINLETGAYYALDDAAADCWMLLIEGTGSEAIVEIMCNRYEVEPERVRDDVVAFVADLERERLVDTDPGAIAMPDVALPALTGKLPYAPPSVNKFDDLEELLLLDPIHEVDDAGWPVARQ